ncbi:MAG TPA: transglutaminaseTgpA domain-containing protein [Ardenticatenaceae bacterium]|jgi:transglutaminase-like putative cysteine protease/uncharacterized membrane protein
MPKGLRLREGWLSFILLLLLLGTVTVSLQAADWTDGLGLLTPVMLMGLLVGVLFAKSGLPGLLLHPFALLMGMEWIAFLSFSLVEDAPWREQLTEIVQRLSVWGERISSGASNPDNLPFILVMAGLMWLIAYVAAWSFYRNHNIWGALLPTGVTILVNTYYGPSELNAILVVFVVLAFLLVIRSNLLQQQARWEASNIAYNPEIQFDFLRDGTVFAVAVVAIAWLLPTAIDQGKFSPFLARVGQPWGRAQQEFDRLFTSLNYQGTGGGAWFGRSMSFRGAINRSDELVMTVRSPQGRYWRAVVFDRYTSAGWVVSEQRIVDGPDGGVALPGMLPEAGRELVGQQYTVYAPAGTLLFAAGQPVQMDVPTQIMLSGPMATETETDEAEVVKNALAQLYARAPLYSGQTYSAISAIPIVDHQSLRDAPTTYPDWLIEHYTDLPETVTPRVKELAEEVTAGLQSPYDKARAIEQYLRSFPYDEGILGPNPGEDGVDYFLFREQKGYCDYYASAMAVMLRSLGIPARIAQGYNQGTQLPSGEFEVRMTNAHTWVEVFFPGYGWLEFEPTASEPVIARAEVPVAPIEDDALPVPDANATQPDMTDEAQALQDKMDQMPPAPITDAGPSFTFDPRVLIVPFAMMAGAGALGAMGWFAIKRRWRGLSPVEQVYDQVGWFGRALGSPVNPNMTPHEYVERVSGQVPPVRAPLRRVADLFAKQRFGRAPLAEDEAGEAQESWREARRPLMREAVRHLPKHRPNIRGIRLPRWRR